MFVIKLHLVILLFLYEACCQRKIQDGSLVSAPKPYAVYLVRAPISNKRYDFWTCGGAIVSSEFVITSAACVTDINYLYVIAGYAEYVTDQLIELNECTKRMKKKVIYTCYPDGYRINYERLEKWSLIDIALVKVESPYDFTDTDYTKYCSYIPSVIPINYEAKYQEPGTDAIVLGWGHLKKWRLENDNNNYNQQLLHFAPVLIMKKNACKESYRIYYNMSEVIDKYMICTLESGNIDDSGEPIEKKDVHGCGGNAKIANGNNNNAGRSLAFPDMPCTDYDSNDDAEDDFRRQVKRINNKFKQKMKLNGNATVSLRKMTASNITLVTNNTAASNHTYGNARRHGICQNDHGGPLITWAGTHEVLIGVASVFKVSEESLCIGPYLYTSTQCNGYFLDCVLGHQDWPGTKEKDKTRRALCKKTPEDVGHPTVERHISWLYHPAGPADNEKHDKRGKSASRKTTKKPDAFKEKQVRDEKFANVPNDKYPANEKYSPNNNYPSDTANGKYLPNNYPAIQRDIVNENYVPNNNYPELNNPEIPGDTLNGKYGPNNNYPAIPSDSAPNIQYDSNHERLIPTERNIGNVWFTRNRHPPYANNGYQEPPMYTVRAPRVPNERYTTYPNILRTADSDGFIMRPQIPLHI